MGKYTFIRIFGVFSIFAMFAGGKVWAGQCGVHHYYDGTSCQECPDDFPSSWTGDSIYDCYELVPHSYDEEDDIEYYSNSASCAVGYYWPKDSVTCNKPCPDHHRCPGGTYFRRGPASDVTDQGKTPCPDNKCPSADHKSCVACSPSAGNGSGGGGNGSGSGGNNTAGSMSRPGGGGNGSGGRPGSGAPNDVTGCPGGYPHVDDGEPRPDRCYKILDRNGNRLYYNEIICRSGKYLPKNSLSCEDCPEGSTCSGGKFIRPANVDQGIDQNGGGSGNGGNGGGGSGGNECGSGYYKPAGGSCTPCPDGFGKSDANADKDTLCYADIDGEKFYYGQAEKCKVGEYLPAKQRVCKPCVGTNKYCPGNNTFYKHPKKDQGIYDCPVYGVANSNKTACNLQIPKLNMKNGPLGAKSRLADQCWFKPTIQQYTKCLLSGSATEFGDE